MFQSTSCCERDPVASLSKIAFNPIELNLAFQGDARQAAAVAAF